MSNLNYKTIFTVLFLLVFSVSAFAQTPQYYNFDTIPGGTNSSPFAQTGGKAMNNLFLAEEFNKPTPLPAGKRITAVYFHTGTAGTRTFTNLHILLKQDIITTLTTGAFYPGPYDTVFVGDTSLTSTVGGWMKITLKNKFNYDPTKSLILFVGQCGASGSGLNIYNAVMAGSIRRTLSVGGCPFVASTGGDAIFAHFGVDVEPAAPVFTLPDLIYYKFKNNPSPASTPNFAIPGVGTNPAPLTTLTLTSGGQFDSCLSGTATASAKIATGYNLSTGTSSFTISFWLNDPETPASTRYLFGDAGFSFRCFVGGVAPASGAVLRGTGVTDVPIRNILPGPSVVHIVYDSASSSVKVYKNGVLDTTVAQTPFNFNAGTGFSVGGYTTSAGLEGLMDEFRFYKRALNQAEITATWNQNLGVITNITPVQTETPKDYKLSQNYPNPFNPATKIGFSIPKSGLTTLKVYDVLGKEIAVLVNETKSAGSYIVDFNASSLSTGVYYYRLEVNGFIDTKKLTLIK